MQTAADIRTAARELGQYVTTAQAQADQQARQLRATGTYAEAYLAERIATGRRGVEEATKAHALELWTDATAVVARLRAAEGAAIRAAASFIDQTKVDAAVADLNARLATAPTTLTGDSRLVVLAEEVRRAEVAQDPSLSRAVRIAAVPLMAATRDNDGQLAQSLRARLAALGDAERAEAAAAGQALTDAEGAQAELRSAILRAEQRVTTSAGTFGPVTEWARDVLGESEEDYGGGVVWRRPGEVTAADFAPAPAE